MAEKHETTTAPENSAAETSAEEIAAAVEETSAEETSAETKPEGPTFAELNIEPRVLAAVEDLGYERPSPIQAATIPTLLEGRDVVGLAQTGTGKTAAFAIPALTKIAEINDVNGPAETPQILVLAPTRELALQVAEAFSSYARYFDDLTILPVYGGSPYGPQLKALRRGAQVVVGTPGRVIDHIERGSLDLSNLLYVVLDEADEMLRMGFAEAVDTILESTPEDKQVALFSATMPKQIRRIADTYLRDPEHIAVDTASTPGANIRQRYIQVMHQYKLDVMTRLLETEDTDGVIAFVRTRQATEDVATKLKARGFRAAAINGDVPQVQREKTVDQLRDGVIDILVATDVAARGLDVERISHVFNYDIPHDTESYVHRIGRTGRAGRTGDAILFMTPRERYLLKHIERATGGTVEEAPIPGIEAVNSSRLGRLAERLTPALEQEDLTPYRELVADYVAENDVDAVQVAAAFAFLAQGGQPLLTEEIPTTPPAKKKRAKRERANDDAVAGERGSARSGGRGGRGDSDKVTYKIAVGRRNRATPGAIVGALANEGGLVSGDIGHIDIRENFTLVDLPVDMPDSTLDLLSDTRVAGRRIDIQLDQGGPSRGGSSHGGGHRDFGERRGGHRGERRDYGDRRGGFRGERGEGGGKFGDRDDRHSSGSRGKKSWDRDDRKGSFKHKKKDSAARKFKDSKDKGAPKWKRRGR